MNTLRQRMWEDMRIRNLSLTTQKKYLRQVASFANYFNKSPRLLGIEDIRVFLLYLAQERKLSASSINVTVSALRFLYKVTLGCQWDIEKIYFARREKKLSRKSQIYSANMEKHIAINLEHPQTLNSGVQCMLSKFAVPLNSEDILTDVTYAGMKLSRIIHAGTVTALNVSLWQKQNGLRPEQKSFCRLTIFMSSSLFLKH